MNGGIVEMLPAENLPFLMEMYRWGIGVIRMIQKAETPALTAAVKFITALGTEKLYIPLLLFIFWWIDEKRGLGLGILLILSAWLNVFMKDVLKQPRPYDLEPALGLAYEPTYGAPSGHAQNSLCFWIPVAAWLGRARENKTGRVLIRAGAVFFILLIGFTRLYLGVHFPTDLFAGWLLGGILLAVWFIPGPALVNFFSASGTRFRNIAAAAAALIMNGLYPRDRTLPALLLGFCVGYTLMRRDFPFNARAAINGKKPGAAVMLLRCLMGFGGMAVIYLGLRLVLPGEGSLLGAIPFWSGASPFYEIGRFIRYGLLGFWVSAGAPRIFQRMGLASVENVGAEKTPHG